MSGQHTPGPWAQGRVLSTPQTQRWTAAERAASSARERRMVFASFSAMDQGRGRIRVAICEREEDARLIAAAPDMLAALQATRKVLAVAIRAAWEGATEDDVNEHATIKQVDAAIAKAIGSAT